MNRLEELRLKQNLTMRETARQLKIPYTTYVNYEKGTREPNSEMLIILAKFFDVSIDYLIGRTDIIEHQNDLLISSQDEDFLLFNRLDIVDKAKIRGEIKQMLKNPKYTSNKTSHIKPFNLHEGYEIAAWGAEGTEGTFETPEEEIT